MNNKYLFLLIGFLGLMFLPLASAFTSPSDFITGYNLSSTSGYNASYSPLSNNNAVTFTSDSTVGQSAQMKSASNQFLNLSTNISIGVGGNTAYTVSVWVKPDTLPPNNAFSSIFYDGLSVSKVIYRIEFFNNSGTMTILSARGINGGADINCFYNYNPSLGQWINIVQSYDGTNMRTFVNGTQQCIIAAAGVGGSAPEGFYLGRNPDIGAASNFNGNISNFYAFTRNLSQSEISTLANAPIATYGSSLVSNYTVSVTDSFTGFTINNSNATATNASGYVWNATSTNGNLTFVGLYTNATYLVNLSITSNQSGGYFTTNYTNVNVASALTTKLSQVYVYFNATELETLNNLSGGVFTISNYTFVKSANPGILFNLTAGTYNISYLQSGFFNVSQLVTYTPLQITTTTVSGIYNSTLNVTAKNNITGATINSLTVQVSNSTYSFTQTVSNTSGFVYLNLTTGSYVYNISSSGFFNAVGNVTIVGNQSNLSVTMLPIGSQLVQFISTTNNSIIYSPFLGTVYFQNGSTQLNFSNVNGQVNASGLIQGVQYYVVCQESSGFANSSYIYTYPTVTTPSPFICYMQPSATTITFVVQDQNQNKLQNVVVTSQQFVNGSLTTLCSVITDATGTATCNLLQGVYTSTTFSLNGYTTVNLINYLPATSYTIAMSSVNQFSPSNTISSFVNYYIQPSPTDLLYNQTMLFNLTVVPTNNISLTNFGINIYTPQRVLVAQLNSTNSSGGSLNLSLNLTPYNGSTLTAEYFFTKQNYTTFTVAYVYNIAQYPYTGTTDELRDWLAANMDPVYRIFLWIFCVVALVLGFRAYGVTGVVMSLIVLGALAALGYIFAIPAVLLTFILTMGAIIVGLQIIGVG